MHLKVVIFDLDGTLIDSNELKYNAFFRIFPDNEITNYIIKKNLSIYGEKSRYYIIEKIFEDIELNYGQSININKNIDKYIERYTELVSDAVKSCDEIPNASNLLRSLSNKYRLFLSSTTPLNFLHEIIELRQWRKYFIDLYGYPQEKISTVKKIIEMEDIKNKEILIVGDGISDKESANYWGCHFFRIESSSDLFTLEKKLLNKNS